MKELRLVYPVPLVSQLLGVSASGYYAWQDRPLSQRGRDELRLELEIKAAHKRTRQTYGSERLQHDLAQHGVQAGICRIKRLRKKLGLRCKQKRKFKVTTDSEHKLPVAENLLGQRFQVEEPNKVWLSDITYIPTDEGWLYLAGHKDLFNGEIVGYAMGERLTRNLVSQSLFRSMIAKRPTKGLLHHSDRGSQYCSHEYRSLLGQFGLEISMSGKGNCFDNAPMESFWGTLKQELIHHRHYRTRQEAMQEIAEYIEIFYNRLRIQPKLGFLSPVAYVQRFYSGVLAA
jgi:putative transposase